MTCDLEKIFREMALEDAIENFDRLRKFKTRQEKIEFTSLCYELVHKDFKYSSEASRYIIDNKLGYKYRHISGHLTFKSLSGEEWILKGGFPENIFSMLCCALGLQDNNTSAEPEEFISFAELGIKNENSQANKKNSKKSCQPPKNLL